MIIVITCLFTNLILYSIELTVEHLMRNENIQTRWYSGNFKPLPHQ